MARWLSGLGLDVLQTTRMLRMSKAFALISISTVALGSGLAIAMISVLNGALWHPLPFPMPPNDRFGLNHDEGLSPFLPDCGKASPEKAVSFLQSRMRAFAIQNGKLLPQGKIFEGQLASILE